VAECDGFPLELAGLQDEDKTRHPWTLSHHRGRGRRATIVQLRDEMDVNIHQIRHLIRSQRELREYVLTDNDAVFTEVEPALTLLYYAYIVLHGPV
jgi:hypothetical protein